MGWCGLGGRVLPIHPFSGMTLAACLPTRLSLLTSLVSEGYKPLYGT